MRKVIAGAVAGLALGAMSAVSAVDISAGIMGSFSSDFGGGVEGKIPMLGNEGFEVKMGWVGGGIKGFFDVTYAEVGIGVTFGSGAIEMKETGFAGGLSDKVNYSFTALNFGLLGKYPIALADNIVLFPAAGIDYQLVLSAKDEYGNDEDDAGDLSALWFKFGAGMDIALTDAIFLRTTLLYGIRLANKMENDFVNELKMPGVNVNSRLGHGLTVNLGIGFKF